MTIFQDFLRSRLESGGFTTEDALASFLPLLGQVVQAHAQGRVAPLEGIDALRVQGVQVWFEEAQLKSPTMNRSALRRLDKPKAMRVQVMDQVRRTTEVTDGVTDVHDLSVGDRDIEMESPVYLPGFVSWEHSVGCHDPLTDVFSLGLILASMACGLDFSVRDDVELFARNRRNLFAINRHLHPVVVKAILKMTELSRHDRPQDLGPILYALTHYRDQETDIDIDLLQDPDFQSKPLLDKQKAVLGKLQDRLFEISRRNRLLHFRPTSQSVNLTHASVPLSFDIRSIRPDHILTWGDKFRKDILAEKPIDLNKYLNFWEALYLPGGLDHIRTEARRDQAEFGLSQLRLVLCFLKWADLKDSAHPRFTSPLILLPVELVKKKGVRDTYWVKPHGTEAEVNPVVRHQFKQLYGINLPETIDLNETDLQDFHGTLQAAVQASDPGVSVELLKKPRIDLIHDLARRRLDQYKRRVRRSGRKVRSFMDLDYSYDPADFKPLGVRIYNEMIRTPDTNIRRIIEQAPRARKFVAPDKSGAPGIPGSSVQKGKQFYSLRDEDIADPYSWEFDLCAITLGNFKYRKMSLVRDYTALLDEPRDNPAFDATFSLAPRPMDDGGQGPVELEERYHVVPCDTTQGSAVALSRTGTSYIIQGPPGTGKSQTITNLIADYIVRGKRVLFVCEKRAAIDVVYHRLKEQGLGDLACLIHDSQADKKAFVMDLKQTYESFIDHRDARLDKWKKKRLKVIQSVRDELQPIDQFNEAMVSAPKAAGVKLHRLIRRAIELFEDTPDVTGLELERYPHYSMWETNREGIDRLIGALTPIQPDLVLANHPLRLLSPALCGVDQPMNRVSDCLGSVRDILGKILLAFESHEINQDRWSSLDDLIVVSEHAVSLRGLSGLGLLGLLDHESEAAKALDEVKRSYARLAESHAKAQEAAGAWKQKLPEAEIGGAIEQARALQGRFTSLFKPAWWRLRGIMYRSYDFNAHVVTPTWAQALELLQNLYRAEAEALAYTDKVRERYGFKGGLDAFLLELDELARRADALPDHLKETHRAWIASASSDDEVQLLARLFSDLGGLTTELGSVMDGYRDLTLPALSAELDGIDGALDALPEFLDCLSELSGLPKELAGRFRGQRLAPKQIEAACAKRSVEHLLRTDRAVNRFSDSARRVCLERLAKRYKEWEQLNARVVLEGVTQQFLDHVKVSSLPAAELTQEQKAFKKSYNKGRREIEHEFGKSMRYKPIRDLTADDSGLVVRDLKPVWLMSPLSVSDTLPLDPDAFDAVIFDEASQITLEEAIPSVFRARQAIVVGDEMQLPPTNFFSAKQSDEDDPLWIEDEGQAVEYDLSSSSFLNHAALNLPSRMLGWHYRSRSESLISFSNWAFYQGRLITIPDEQVGEVARDPVEVDSPEAGDEHARFILDRPVGFHYLQNGIYHKRRNRDEADYIAHLVRGLLNKGDDLSIGIVAFSEAQQTEIEEALKRLASEDRAFKTKLDAELEREDDGQFVGLLVKNLENIQGDERDIVIMSVCYGYNTDRKMRMNFGPINQSGGDKRLNVAFSRAKQRMVLVSSILDTDITNDYNDGASCLKHYLRYAEACSRGDGQAASHTLDELAVWRDDADDTDEGRDEVVAESIAREFEKRGYRVDHGVGQSAFRCDLALARQGDQTYRVGVLIDHAQYYKQSDLIERDLVKPTLLKIFGWRIATVLAKDWYEDRDGVIEQIEGVISDAER